MKTFSVCLILAGGLVLTGCQTMLENWPSARQFPERGAVAQAEGMQMAAYTGAWEGIPSDLPHRMTPVLVAIKNESGQPITIRHNRFHLISDEGRRYMALPPFKLDQHVGSALGNPYYLASELDYPANRSYFPGASLHGGPLVWNTPHWNRFGPVLGNSIPTEEMVRSALPEGVLQPGAQASGFLYFEGVARDVDRVHLRADFEDQASGDPVAHLTIPLNGD